MAIKVDSSGAGRVSQRYLDYVGQNTGNVLGHYRAVTFSTSAAVLSATDIIASLWWADATRFFVLERLAMNVEVLTAITIAPVFDAQAFVFRGATGASAGTGSSVLSGTGPKQQLRKTMGAMILTQAGELRTVGATVKLTACTGKTNDSAPFGAAFWGGIEASNATGTAVLMSVGAFCAPGWQDLYSLSGPYAHPLVLSQNEGIEIQLITANNTTGSVKYGFLWEWAEVESI